MSFGGAGNIESYFIGTNLENYGGNYTKLDIRWHTGIRMGAQPGYGGIRFYDNEALGTQIFAIGKDGSYGQANQSMRAPLFYDLDNTAYYGDFASTSVLNEAQFNGYIGIGGNGPTTNMSGTFGVSIKHASYPAIGFTTGSTGPNYLIYRTGAGGPLNVWNSTQGETVFFYSTYTQFYGSARAPLFYDSDNTSYYIDAASTSVMNRISTVRTNDWLYIDNNYGHSVVGVYASTRYQGVFAMGDAYKLPADGTTTGNLYGIAWSHPNAGGAAANLGSHGMLILENGTFKGAWGGGSLRTTGDIRATIYYDYDNTGFYFNPNGESNLGTTVTGDNAMYFRSNRNTTSSSPPLQAYSNDAGGAIMSFHRGGYYAVNFGLDSDNVMRIGGWSASANRWQLDMSGNMYAAGNITAYSSDIRLKENIVTIDNALSKLQKIRGVYYDWKDIVDDLGFNPIDRHDIGVIAQEVGEVIPQAIKPAPFDTGCDGKSESGENYVTVQMEKIIPLLIEAIKELNIKVETLESKLNGN
jgi:hypothetical protein